MANPHSAKQHITPSSLGLVANPPKSKTTIAITTTTTTMALLFSLMLFIHTFFLYHALFLHHVLARSPSNLESRLLPQIRSANVSHSLDVSTCPGYSVTSIKQSAHGLTASLGLAGSPCNAFGTDVQNLTVQVTYETTSRYGM